MLSKLFYEQNDTMSLAALLLGKTLVHHQHGQRLSGRIVETEAYLFDDPAAHSFKGKTPRNQSMFETAGHCYIYFIYGMYHCFNVVSGPYGVGEAVLIRALEPLEGIPQMRKNRNFEDPKHKDTNLCNGPSKLVMALDIPKSLNGNPIFDGPLFIEESVKTPFEIVRTTRIGLSKAADLPYRFYIKNNKYISKA